MMDKIESLRKHTSDLHLLYVEDDSVSREGMMQILSFLFKSIDIAFDGVDGSKKYRRGKYDLVITDIRMPKMDGLALCEFIRSINPTQKIIITSAYDTSDYLYKAIRNGVDGFIIKPVELEQFGKVMSKIVQSILDEKIRISYQKILEDQVHEQTEELLNNAMRDPLTGFYNRTKLMETVYDGQSRCAMLINIDNFDNINTIYGYESGDRFLIKSAKFFMTHFTADGQWYRIGDDEFVFLFESMNLQEAYAQALGLHKVWKKYPINHEGFPMPIGNTIIVTKGEKELVKELHIGFKESRIKGKDRVTLFTNDKDFEKHQKKLFAQLHLFNTALREDSIVPVFQPIFDNRTGMVKKYECLARIVQDGVVYSPFEFMEAAILSGRQRELTRTMIEKSIQFFSKNHFEFSINITEHDLDDSWLHGYLMDMCRKYSVTPDRIVLEVLEGISASCAEKQLVQLMDLKQEGFKLAIDDFGAQNSNFERVFRLKVNYIKIDGRFIKEIDTNINSFYIAKTITDFSKNVGAEVIAEYVHSKSVLEKVKELGIEYSQGYYLGKPQFDIIEGMDHEF